MMTGKEKLYFLLDAIDDAKTITPSGQPLAISALNDLNRKLSAVELSLLFTKLEKDEQVLRLLKEPNRVKTALDGYDLNDKLDDGRYHFELLPAFDKYFLKIQREPEYQKFTGRISSSVSGGGVSVDVFTSDLQAKYKDIQNEKGINRFYLKLADYGKCLNGNDVADPIFAELYADSQKQITNLKEHWKGFFKIWKDYAGSLVKKADEVGIKDEGPLQDELGRLRSYLGESDPQFSDTDLPNYWQPYREIIQRFDKAGLKNMIFNEHFDKINGDLKLYPEYRKVEVAWDKYKQARELSIWWAHYQISRLAAGVAGTEEEKGHYFKNDNYIDQMYKFEFDKIGRGEANTLIFLRKDKFEDWIGRLHAYLIPRLKELTKDDNVQPETRYEELLEEIRGASEIKYKELEGKYKKLIADINFNNTKTLKTDIKLELSDEQSIKNTSSEVEFKYEVSYKFHDIFINNIKIANPNFNSENDLVFEYLFSNPNKTFNHKQVEEAVHMSLKKPFNKIVENLGFKKDLRKHFFNVSSKSIRFNNPVFTSQKLQLV